MWKRTKVWGGGGAALRWERRGKPSRKPVNTAGCTSAAGAQLEHSWSAAGAQLGRGRTCQWHLQNSRTFLAKECQGTAQATVECTEHFS